MEKQERIKKSKPIELVITNSSDEGKYVDAFRNVDNWPEGVIVNTTASIPLIGIEEEELPISYKEILTLIANRPMSVGMIILDCSIPICEIDRKTNLIRIISFDVHGTAVTIPINFCQDPYQIAINMAIIDNEYMMDSGTFIRVWMPANCTMKIYLFPIADVRLGRELIGKTTKQIFKKPEIVKSNLVDIK